MQNHFFISIQQKPLPQHQAWIPANLKVLKPMLFHVKKQLQGRDIDSTLSLKVVRAILTLQVRYCEAKRKKSNNTGKEIPPAKIKDTITSLFGISATTYSRILTDYIFNRSFYRSGKGGGGRTGNTSAKDTRIQRTKATQIKVRDFVRSKRMKKERVTARQILDFLVQEKLLFIQQDAMGQYMKKDFDSACRNVCRYMKSLGY